jgi:hypothetical protein
MFAFRGSNNFTGDSSATAGFQTIAEITVMPGKVERFEVSGKNFASNPGGAWGARY